MTKANECTCPSGDGSLRHPCPAHPASVELAGVGAKLTFINGRPAMCGCQVEYSSGGGEYSDVIDVTLCAKHSGSAILDLVATNRIALTPEYEGQWHADLYLDREIPLAKADGATPAEAVLALMSAERIDPEQESVEQAGGDERAAFRPAQVISYRPGMGEVTIYVAGRVPGYMNIGDTVYVSDRAPVEQPSAALAQPSPVSEALIYACKNLAQITSSDGSGHADIALAVLRMAGVGDDERERLVNEWKAARAWKPSPAQAEAERPPQPERYTADVFHPERPYYMAQTSVVRASDFDEFATQYERIVGALRFERQQMDRAFTACINERDAALAEVKRNKLTIAAMNEAHAKLAADLEAVQARVAELEKQEPAGAPMPDEIHQMAFEEGQPAEDGDGYLFSAEEFDLFVQRLLDSCAAPVAQPEETPGEILAAKLIETWVTKHGKPAPWSTAVEITAVATNMPNDERERLLALDDDVDAQAQHSVPEGWRIERSAERIVVMNLKNGAGYAAARDGESGIAESVLYLLAADLLAAAPGKEVGHE